MAKIAIVTRASFCMNPRVWKEADALSTAHDVTVFGVPFDRAQAALDQQMLESRRWNYHAAVDLTGRSFSSKMEQYWYRLTSRRARYWTTYGLPDPDAIGYGIERLYDTVYAAKADLTIVHLEPGFWVGSELAKAGRRIGADFEDWHSENSPELAHDDPQICFYRSLEQQIVHSAQHLTAESEAMCEALLQTYKGKRPEVVHNSVYATSYRPRRRRDATVRLIWFSQTIGQGRGLEDLFAALPHVQGDWELELRGHHLAATEQWVTKQVPAQIRRRIRLEPIVPVWQLTDVIAENDIGLALEIPTCRNKDLTASNKLFRYIQSGLPVIASDTIGQREVLKPLDWAAQIYRSGDKAHLAELLNRWVKKPTELFALRERLYQEANALYAYEQQIPRLLTSVERALYSSPPTRESLSCSQPEAMAPRGGQGS